MLIKISNSVSTLTMNVASKQYLMVVNVRYYRVNQEEVALEGAFIEHLKLLRGKLSSTFDHFAIAMVEMEQSEYETSKSRLSILNETSEEIFVEKICGESPKTSKIQTLYSVAQRLKELVSRCNVLHVGLSHDLFFPMTFMALLWAIFYQKKIIYIVDIDFRNSALMNYRAGRWSLKSYLACKLVYDKFRALQVKVAISKSSLVLLKGKEFCRDFGKGKANVKNFLNSAYSKVHIIKQDALNQKITHVKDADQPFEVVYFGRLTAYKGIDLCLRAVAIAKQKMACDIKFHILGDGEERQNLESLAQELGLQDNVVFYGALPFNMAFFQTLQNYHLLLAAPLSEDTPRSALDAMASGIPILAFDTYYYRDLVSTGAVDTVPWLSVEQLAEKLSFYSSHRAELATMMGHAAKFAHQNTQEKWLEQRIDWTRAFVNVT